MSEAGAVFILAGAVYRDPQVESWFDITDPFRMIVRPWFERARKCGGDVRELVHDGRPTLCVEQAAFVYFGAYRAHATVGFFDGAALPDSAGLLEGTGKRMRHVKLRPGNELNEPALTELITAAYAKARRHLSERSPAEPPQN